MIRTFIGVPIENNELAQEIIELQKRLKNFSGIKLVEPQNLHFTIKFLGFQPPSKIEEIKTTLSSLFSSFSPFEVVLKNTGVFPNEKFIRVIWIGVENPENFIKLMQAVDNQLSKLGFLKEKSYVPHLTIARVKTLSEREKLVKILREISSKIFGKMIVNNIVLYESKLFSSGPVYTKLHEWKL